MRYAVQNDYIDSNPAVDMAGALSTVKARHYPALPFSRFPEFLERLAAYRGRIMTRIAVEFSLLTFVRSSELRFARWDEFDLERALWPIPCATQRNRRRSLFSPRHEDERGASCAAKSSGFSLAGKAEAIKR